MIADVLTKGWNFYHFAKLREMAAFKSQTASEGECYTGIELLLFSFDVILIDS